MSPQTITRESYRAALQEAVDAKGAGFVYTPPGDLSVCQYRHWDTAVMEYKPGCLHGHALALLGHELDESSEYTDITDVLGRVGVTDDGLLDAAQASQTAQDTGTPWGAALEAFDLRLSL